MYERYLKLYRSPLHRDAWTNYKSFKRRRPIAMSHACRTIGRNRHEGVCRSKNIGRNQPISSRSTTMNHRFLNNRSQLSQRGGPSKRTERIHAGGGIRRSSGYNNTFVTSGAFVLLAASYTPLRSRYSSNM